MIKKLLRISLTLCMSFLLQTVSFASDVNILYSYSSTDDYDDYDAAYVAKLQAEGYAVTTMLYGTYSADVVTNSAGYDLIIIGQGTTNNATQDQIAALDIPVLLQADVVNRYGFGNRIRSSGVANGLAYTTSTSDASEAITSALDDDITFAASSSAKSLDLSVDTQSADLIPIYSLDNNSNRLPVAALEAGATCDGDAGTAANRRGFFGVVNSSLAMNDDLAAAYVGMANWLLDIHTITVSSTAGGSIDAEGSIAIPGGKSKTFTFTAESGYTIQDVTVDDVSLGILSSYTFDDIATDHTISVRFLGEVNYTITATTQGEGSISPDGTLITSAGFDETYVLTPEAGFEVKAILVNGSPVDTEESYTFTDINANQTIEAVFQPNTRFGGGSILYAYEDEVNYPTYDQKYVETLTERGFDVETILYDDLVADAATLSAGKDLIIVGYGTPNSSSQANIANLDIPVLLQAAAVAKYGFAEKIRSNNNLSSLQIAPTTTDAAAIISNGSSNTISFAGVSQSKPIDLTDDVSTDLIQVYHVGDNNRWPIMALETGALWHDDVTITTARRGYFSVLDISTAMNDDLATLYVGMVKWLMDFKRITATASAGGTIVPSGNVEIFTGSSQGFEIAPNEGHELVDVLVNDISIGIEDTYSFENVVVAQSITVDFSIITYNITASSGENGSVSPTGVVSVDYGSNQTFTFTPEEGFRIADVLVNGEPAGASGSYSFENVKQVHSLSVSFEPIPTYTVIASAGENGTIDPEGSEDWFEGTDLTFNFTPDLGYQVDDVLVDNVSVGAVASYTFDDLMEAHTITVSFAIQTFDIVASAVDNGSISPEGVTVVAYDGSQTYTITPNEGYEIEDVKVDNKSMGAIESHTFESVTTAHTISATFSKLTYIIIATANENGAISPAELVNVAHGASQSFAITADEGYVVEDVLVNKLSVGAITSYTFENVTEAQSISATFSKLVVVTELRPKSPDVLILYPNPSSGSVTIDTKGPTQILIRTIDGKLVDHIASTGISQVTGLQSGTYLIQTKTQNEIEITKLIVH